MQRREHRPELHGSLVLHPTYVQLSPPHRPNADTSTFVLNGAVSESADDIPGPRNSDARNDPTFAGDNDGNFLSFSKLLEYLSKKQNPYAKDVEYLSSLSCSAPNPEDPDPMYTVKMRNVRTVVSELGGRPTAALTNQPTEQPATCPETPVKLTSLLKSNPVKRSAAYYGADLLDVFC